MRPIQGLKIALVLGMTQLLWAAHAEIYFSRGPDGERLVSDRPIRGYRLINQRDTVKDAGFILANRFVPMQGRTRFGSYIRHASHQFGVDPALVEAVIRVESDFDPNAISHKGAAGLMQLMSATADQYHVNDRHNPRENINAGVKHLSKLMDQFDGKIPLVVAAYNAGASAVKKYNGIPPYPETRRYVARVMNFHSYYRRVRRVAR